MRDAVRIENSGGLIDEVDAIDHESNASPAGLRLVHDVGGNGRLAGARGGDQHLRAVPMANTVAQPLHGLHLVWPQFDHAAACS